MRFNPLKIFKKKNDEIIDLGKLHKDSSNINQIGTANEQTNEQKLGFIGNLASASDTTDKIKTNMDPEKVDRFGRRLDRLLGRLELIERKIERIEHRMDIS
jgi:hypothetical protein